MLYELNPVELGPKEEMKTWVKTEIFRPFKVYFFRDFESTRLNATGVIPK